MLSDYGFSIPKSRLVPKEQVPNAAEEIGFPVVLKAVVPEISHKTECGGVALNLNNLKDVSEAAIGMSGIAENFIVEEMITDGVAELILGLYVDPQFGPTLTLGAGGIFTELMKDSVAILFPVSEKQVREYIEKLRINVLLKGWRGKPGGDTEALVEAVILFADFVEHHADSLFGCEINPLIVRPSGKGVVAVDVLINFK
jgi:acetyl-CoA synthetase